ncbi:MAG: hypothetical protein R3C17_18025 [Planctomycetaceae bacterium]
MEIQSAFVEGEKKRDESEDVLPAGTSERRYRRWPQSEALHCVTERRMTRSGEL